MMLNAAALLSLTSVFSCRLILHIRSEASSVAQQSADRHVDWSNGFGRPADSKSPEITKNSRTHLWTEKAKPHNTLTSRKASDSSQHSSYYGCKSFEDLPDFQIRALSPMETYELAEAHPSLPQHTLPVRISQEVHQRVEVMTEDEVDWEKNHPPKRSSVIIA